LSILDLVSGSTIETRRAVTNEDYKRFYAGGENRNNNIHLIGKVRVSKDGKMLAYGRDDGLFRIWRLESGRIGQEIYAKKFAKLEAFALSADFETIVASTGEDAITGTAVSTDRLLYKYTKPGLFVDKIVCALKGTKCAI